MPTERTGESLPPSIPAGVKQSLGLNEAAGYETFRQDVQQGLDTLRNPQVLQVGLNAESVGGNKAVDLGALAQENNWRTFNTFLSGYLKIANTTNGFKLIITADNLTADRDLQAPDVNGTAVVFTPGDPVDSELLAWDNVNGLVKSVPVPSSGVTDVTATAPISSSGGSTPDISHDDSAVTPGSYTNASITVDQKGHVTAASNGTAPVTSVGATAPIASSGGATPTISHDDTAVTPGSYTNVSATVDQKGHITAMSNGTAPVTSVGGTAPVASSGGTTPTISMAAATSGNDGYMTGVYAGKLDGIESGADVTDSTNVASALDGFATDGSPTLVDSDYVAIYTGGAWLRITLAQLKAYVLA